MRDENVHNQTGIQREQTANVRAAVFVRGVTAFVVCTGER